ncbi:hypothetical protein RBWH47_04741 [Rhodopirellula baltica WH47]|uniref:Uncharacterized protein n=2 Tax=Rhodopirellula baltica TaxID=265606 RepID=F2ALS8_RHOBT|nr:hypothetical protein RBWH47_04741 [Rhodopirellula baltica WH47]
MCNPSRISLLWGRRPSSTGFYSNRYPVAEEPEFLSLHVSLPAYFAANGYKTLTAGKVFHSSAPVKDHFQVVGPRPGHWLKGLDKKFTTSRKDGTASGTSAPRTTMNRSSPITSWPPG